MCCIWLYSIDYGVYSLCRKPYRESHLMIQVTSDPTYLSAGMTDSCHFAAYNILSRQFENEQLLCVQPDFVIL